MLLTHYGFDARVAGTVAGGVAEVDAWRPQAVLLDLVLPDGSGVTVFRRVRERLAGARVAVVSGALRDRRVADALAPLRPDRLFAKPVDFYEVRAWLQAVGRGTP